MKKVFNPNQFTGKNTEYAKLDKYHGICSIWDWNEVKKRYEKREFGLKYYAYKKAGGIQKSKCFESFDLARKWRESSNVFFDETHDVDMLFRDVLKRYFAHIQSRIKESTFQTYENQCKHLEFFHALPMSQINSRAVDVWLERVKKPEYVSLQHRTRLSYENELSLLRQIFTYYSEYLCDSFQMPLKKRHIEDSIINRVRFLEAKAKNKAKFIPPEDYNRFLVALRERASKNPKYFVFYALALLQLRTGCRVGEACALSYKDIDFENRKVTISKTVHWARKKGSETKISSSTKTGEAREVSASFDLLAVFDELKMIQQRSVGLIFSENGFSPITYRNVQAQFNVAFKMASLTWSSTHILRHSFATHFLEVTQNQHALKSQLGHKNIGQTDHYSKTTAKLAESGYRLFEKKLTDENLAEVSHIGLGQAGK
jgi:integrase